MNNSIEKRKRLWQLVLDQRRKKKFKKYSKEKKNNI